MGDGAGVDIGGGADVLGLVGVEGVFVEQPNDAVPSRSTQAPRRQGPRARINGNDRVPATRHRRAG